MAVGVVLMHIERVVLRDLDHAAADVGAVVGHTLKVGEKVGEDEAVLDGTLALLKSLDVIELDLITKIVYNLLESVDVAGSVEVVVKERLVGELEDLAYRSAEHVDLSVSLG